MSILYSSGRNLPANFKKKHESAVALSNELRSKIDQVTCAFKDYTSMWDNTKTILDYMYNEAVIDNNIFEFGLTLPCLPSLDDTVESKNKYLTLILYIVTAVSHCKTLILKHVRDVDLATRVSDLDAILETYETSSVADLSIEQHLLEIERTFDDERGRAEGERSAQSQVAVYTSASQDTTKSRIF
jgi:hypothetical protein